MKVLLIGGGGREHALGWKIAQSPLLAKIYVDSANPGLNHIGERMTIDTGDLEAVSTFAAENHVDLVVIGPEAPLAAGLGDRLRACGVPCFGPDKAAAMLETSKAFMKEICDAASVPTAGYGVFTDAERAKAFLREQSAPFVVKADGLAAGKGVVIAESLEDADKAVDEMFAGKFGDAGASIVIEEFMEGEEASFFAICDGETVLPLIAAQDHKRAFDGDRGPNTGGMGAYSPAPVFTEKVRQRTIDKIINPIISEMAKRGSPYIGVLYAGLMIKDEEPKLVEINARFGDPECQVLMRRLDDDILPILSAAAKGRLAGKSLNWRADAAALIVMAAKGYPGAYQKGSVIAGTDDAEALDRVVIYHAGACRDENRLLANGGRVLNVTATGPTVRDAVAQAYAGVKKIDWPDGFYRTDIGWRAMRENA
ncbi:MAG: phosphoribosylamine--glycine ligase [Pseudomonadota bacterium]